MYIRVRPPPPLLTPSTDVCFKSGFRRCIGPPTLNETPKVCNFFSFYLHTWISFIFKRFSGVIFLSQFGACDFDIHWKSLGYLLISNLRNKRLEEILSVNPGLFQNRSVKLFYLKRHNLILTHLCIRSTYERTDFLVTM